MLPARDRVSLAIAGLVLCVGASGIEVEEAHTSDGREVWIKGAVSCVQVLHEYGLASIRSSSGLLAQLVRTVLG